MKRVVQGVIAVVAIVTMYFAISPYVAMHGLKSAIRSGDSAALEDHIDFLRVREDLKAQLNAAMLEEMTSELKDNPFSAPALALAPKLIEGMVDSFITPQAMASLARGQKPSIQAVNTADAHSTNDVFANARVTRDGLDRFSAWVPNDQGKEVRFVFHRYGFGWKLTSLSIPMPAAADPSK